MGEADVTFLILRHPVMQPDVGFIELPSGLVFQDSVAPLPEHAAMRAANHAMDEQWKKKKDDEEEKLWSKQQAKLQRGKRCHGSSEEEEEEEEEEEDDSSMSPILWDDLATGDEDAPSLQAGPFTWHVARQEGEDAPPEPTKTKRPTTSGPSTAAPEPAEIGCPAPSKPSAAPLGSARGAVLICLSPPSRGRTQSGNVPMRSS